MPSSRKSAVRFRERAELLDFMLEVAAVTSETLDLDRLMARIAEVVKQVIPYDLFAILLYSEKTRGLRIRYAIGHRKEIVDNLVVSLGEGLTGAAAAAREPVLVNDVRADVRYLNAMDAVRSELAVPMLARGRLVGVIDLQSTRLDAFTEHDRSLARLIASRIATSIDNARLHRRVERQNRTLRTLAHLSQEFSSILDLDELLRHIAEAVRGLIDYDAFSILLVDNEKKVLRHRFSVRYDQRVEVDNVPLGSGITGASVAAREVVRVADTLADPRYIASHPDIRSEVAVPLTVQDRVIGVMDLESSHIAYFSDDHVRMLSLLAPQVASSVENARLYHELAERERAMQQDLSAARKLQSVLLPRTAPEIQGLEAGVASRPARQISGDLYEFFEQGEHALIAVGDSSGKGAAAALYGATVSGLLRSMAPRRRGPALLMQSLNEALLERRVDAHFVTLLVLLWDFRDCHFTMANAGSEPPLLCRDGQVQKLKVEGIPLGLLDGREYDEHSFSARPGDVLLLYSDGVGDQQNPAGEPFGRGRVAGLLKRLREERPQAIVEAFLAELDRFSGGGAPADDQTLIALKVL
jgi:sigma-B regulation protein RsbU (phosphoserine phosphatase)